MLGERKPLIARGDTGPFSATPLRRSDSTADSRTGVGAPASRARRPSSRTSHSRSMPVASSTVRAAFVSTNVGGIPGLVFPDETGLLVPPEDPDALADALRTVLTDRDLRTSMG